MAADRIDEVLEALEVPLRKRPGKYMGACPIHGGHNPFSFHLYPDGHYLRGYWVCHSKKCHTHFTSSLVGLVRGVLSHRERGWSSGDDERVAHRTAVGWLCNTLGIRLSGIKRDSPLRKAMAQHRKQAAFLAEERPEANAAFCTTAAYRRAVEVPSEYYLRRGYGESVLRTFMVGRMTQERSKHYNRIVYPVFDRGGEKIIGVVSRSPHPTCPSCKRCHATDACPSSFGYQFMRWWADSPYILNNHLYNLHRAEDPIRDSRSVILVEGAGDVWRLWESGIYNVVGLFGSKLSGPQEVQLQQLLVRDVIVLSDNDEAGHSLCEDIVRRCSSFWNVRRVLPVKADEVGDMTVKQIKRYLQDQL